MQESLEAYKKADYKDQTQEEEYNLSVLKAYLPQELSVEKIQVLVREAITESKASSPKDMGAVMKLAMTKSQGAADGKTLSQMVKEELQKL